MTRASPRSVRLWKNQSKKWLGRLLGCVTLRPGACGRSCSSDVDLPDTKSHPPKPDVSCDKPRKSLRNSHRKMTASSQGSSAQDGVVLLAARGVDEASEEASFCDPTASDPTSPGLFGDLEMALFSEGLLEYRDPLASGPVLTIGYGFSNEELRALSKASPTLSKDLIKWDERWPCRLDYDKLLPVHGCQEPLIDGLPASVWLECVEPTLSILISLNALRHRRSNLSLKKGLPETLDSNRSRHGDFEFGPIAIFHHPRRMEQLMLLRVDFLNAAAAATANGHQLTDINQSAEYGGRRAYNRNRRFRHPQSTSEIFADDVRSSNEDAIINISSNNSNSKHENSYYFFIDVVSGDSQHVTDIRESCDDNAVDVLNFQVDTLPDGHLFQNHEEISLKTEPWHTQTFQNLCQVVAEPTELSDIERWSELSWKPNVWRRRGSLNSAQIEVASPKDIGVMVETLGREEVEQPKVVSGCRGLIISQRGLDALHWGHYQNRNSNAKYTDSSRGSSLGALVSASSAVMLGAAVPNGVDSLPLEPPATAAAPVITANLTIGQAVSRLSHTGDGINIVGMGAPDTVTECTLESSPQDSLTERTGCDEPTTLPQALAAAEEQLAEEQPAEEQSAEPDLGSLQIDDDMQEDGDIHEDGGDNELKLLVPSLKASAIISEVQRHQPTNASSSATITTVTQQPAAAMTRTAQASSSVFAFRSLARSAHDMWARWRVLFRDSKSRGRFGRLRER